jgi:hypothetical protein
MTRRNRSPAKQEAATTTGAATATTIVSANPTTLANAWMEDMNQDVDIQTGYLVKEPKGVFGRRVKELINHTMSQSSEVKAILNSRKAKPHPFTTYAVYICGFLAEYVFPVLLAGCISYLYYRSSQTEVDPNQPPPVKPFKYRPQDTSFNTAIHTGGFLGDFTHGILSVPVGLILGFMDRGLRISEIGKYMVNSRNTFVYTPILFVIVYFLSLFVFRFILNLYKIWRMEKTLWSYQEIVLQETERILERAITGFLRSHLLDYFHAYMNTEPDNPITIHVRLLKSQFVGQEEGIRMSILDTLSHKMKLISFADIMCQGRVSPEYLDGVHKLIRHADESLSTTMFNLNREIVAFPGIQLKLKKENVVIQ